MLFLRALARFTLLIFILTLLPFPLDVYATGSFTLTTSRVRNETNGETSYVDSTTADPGDTLNLFFYARNSGPDLITAGRMTMPVNADWTPVDYSIKWRYNSASNALNSNTGEYLISPLYIDSDSDSAVSSGDIRLNKYGVDSTATGPLYTESSTVAGGDDDTTIGTSLTSANDIYISGGDATWASGEIAYIKGSGNTTTTAVEIDDIRITSNGSYLAGTEVVTGDTDICTGCLTNTTNIVRMGSTLWPFDEGGFPVGNWPVNTIISGRTVSVVIDSDSSSSISSEVTFAGTTVTSASKASTVNVDTTPSVTSVTLTPSSITNDGSSTTTATVVATDKNGAGDISSVTLDLSTLGSSSTTTLYDDGTNGDTTASDGTWSLSGITTTATAGTYTALTATATDSTSQTATASGTLIVQAGGTPTMTVNSTSPTTVGSSGTVTVNWQADEPLYKYEVQIGSCSGTLATGTNVSDGDGSAQILASATAVASILDNSNFSSEASYDVYICGTDADSNVGQNFTTVTKDLTAPTVSVTSASPGNITTGQTSTVNWSADETGTYTVKIGSCSGSTVTGDNASGTYSTASQNIASGVTVGDLSEGSNTVYVCVTDDGSNQGSGTITVSKDTTAPTTVSGVTLSDTDSSGDGVDGLDLKADWTAATTDSSFSRYEIYVLPEATTLDTGSHSTVKLIGDQTTVTWTGDATVTNDSAGTALTAGNYKVHIIAKDTVGLTSSSASSSAATLTLDDTSAPTFSSATTVDANTVKLIFSEGISFVDTSNITATGLAIDTSYNSDSYTNGYKIQSSDAKNIFLRTSSALATSYTASDLALTACAVRDVTGSSDLNESGNCSATAASTNANADATSLAISDGFGPTITLASPSASGTDNATISIDYTLDETAGTNTVKLKFTATGGTSDSNSPHTIIITDSVEGSDAESASQHTFSLTGSSFTSIENGASDTLVDGAIYTVALDASDTSGNAGTTASNTFFTYDTTAPSAPTTTQGFSSPTADNSPMFTWSSVSDAISYTLELSLNSTSYSPSFATQTLSQQTLTAASWTGSVATFTATSHGLSVGETVTIASVTPSDYDGDYTVASVPTTDTFTVAIGSDPGTYTSGGTALATSWILSSAFPTPSITAASWSSNVATFTSDSHGLSSGTTIVVNGATPSDYDGTYTIASVSDSDTFTVSLTTDPGTYTSGGTVYGGSDDTYIWRMTATDTAGNTSSASNQQTFVLDTVTDDPQIVIQDASNSSTAQTNSDTVNVVIDAYSVDVTHYLLSETQSTQPAAGSITTAIPGVASQTVSFTFASATEETKTIYVWVKDSTDNISLNANSTTITLDTTVPSTPTVSATDADGGASSGNTNAAAVTIAISNDSDATKWCAVSDTSTDATPTDPTESDCSTGQTGAEVASGWLTTEPTSHTLSGTGTKKIYIWTQDTAGNVSTVSTAVSIDYQTTTITDPTLTVTDTSSSSQYYTDTTSVTIAVGDDASADKWIVSESQSGQPAESSLDWGSEPTSLTFSSGDGSKTVYVWVKSAYGNISSSQVSATITLNTTVPTISTKKTQDLDSDGQIDAVQITMSESITDSTIVLGDFSLSDSYSFNSGLSSTVGSVSFTGGIATGDSTDDSIFYLAVTESGSSDTGTTQNLTYVKGSLTDLASNFLASASAATLTDGVAPQLYATDPVQVLDTDSDGLADQVKVIFTEALSATTATSVWTLSNVPSSGALSSVAIGTTNTASDTIVMTLTEGSGAPDTTAGSFTVALTNTGSEVKDSASNAVSDLGATAGVDQMGPALVSANYISSSSTVTLSFSESLTDASSSLLTDSTNTESYLTPSSGWNSGALASDSTAATGTDDDDSVTISLGSTAAPSVGTDTIALVSGAVTDGTTASSHTATVAIGGGLIINEISWAGSSGKTGDEWIELFNLSSSAVDFTTSYHCLYVGTTKLADLTGAISGDGYYLASQYNQANASSALNVAPDLSNEDDAGQFSNGWVTLSDTALQVILYSSADATCDNSSDTAIDTAGDDSTPLSGNSGTPATMERNSSIGLGTSSGSWHMAVSSTNFDDTNQNGTPGVVNVSDSSGPSFDTSSPDNRSPGHQVLRPDSPPIISVTYSDNSGGTGVDTSSITMELDLNGDGDYTDTNEDTSGVCSGSALTTKSTTTVACDLSSTTLSAGKHSVRVTVADTAGNSNSTSWDFWVDQLTMTVENASGGDLGVIAPTTAVQTDDNSQHTKVTITTYGAGITLTGSADGAMTSGGDTIAWHTHDTGTAGTGTAWRVKEGASGSFGNYFSFQSDREIATKSKFTGSQLASTNALQTYTFYIQYYVNASAVQEAGDYSKTISYSMALTY